MQMKKILGGNTKMSSSGNNLFAILCTFALGSAILYLLNRLRQTDRRVQLLHGYTRQTLNVEDVNKILEQRLRKRDQNLNTLINKEVEKHVEKYGSRVTLPVEEEENEIETTPKILQQEKEEGLSFDISQTDSIANVPKKSGGFPKKQVTFQEPLPRFKENKKEEGPPQYTENPNRRMPVPVHGDHR